MLKSPKPPFILAMIPWILVTMVCVALPGLIKVRCGKENAPSAPEVGWMQVDEGFTTPGSALPREMDFDDPVQAAMASGESSWKWLPVVAVEEHTPIVRGRGESQGRAPPVG